MKITICMDTLCKCMFVVTTANKCIFKSNRGDLVLCACISISNSLVFSHFSLSLLFFLAGHTLLSSLTDCIVISYKCCNGPLLQAFKVYCTKTLCSALLYSVHRDLNKSDLFSNFENWSGLTVYPLTDFE